MKKLLLLLLAIFSLNVYAQLPCIAPDNGTGICDYPHLGCTFVIGDPLLIMDGLPPGTTIEIEGVFEVTTCGTFLCPTAPPGLCEDIGGSLAGTRACFSGLFNGQMMGTGSLAGYTQLWQTPFEMIVDLGPRAPGDPDVVVPTEIVTLQLVSSIPPDFTQLTLFSGVQNGLSGPGTARMSRLPDGTFNVDSFFDITYRIEFTGSPGSILDGYSGLTTSSSQIRMGTDPPEGPCCFDGPPGCQLLTEMDCQTKGGNYIGDNLSCSEVSCGPDTGTFIFGMADFPGIPPELADGSNQYQDTAGGGFNGWYEYPSGWWNIWYYNDPFDSTRWKEVNISFDLEPLIPGTPTDLVVAVNYSTPLWSLQADTSTQRMPPLPGNPILNENLHIVRDTVLFIPAGTMLDPFVHYNLYAYIPDYNPEWVSVDVMGGNYLITNGTIIHECLPPPVPPLGRCCIYDTMNASVICLDVTHNFCQSLGGTWDAALNCADDPCPQAPDSGACCLPNKQCAQMDAAGCAAAGGTYHGDGSQCDTVNCGPISDGFNISRLPGSLPGTPPSSAGGSGQFDDGTGFNGWYYYENQEWWNIWFYDHPLDSNRYKKVTISFDLMPITAGIPVTLDFALNWATPLYSLDTFNTPPLPPIAPGLEDQWIGRYLFPMELPEVDTVLMVKHYEFCYYFPDYNPEWVSIDIRGDNFEIFNGEITHECIYGPVPPIGRCCYSVAGSDSVLCQDTYECVCDYLGGDWVDSLNCADDPCPQAPDSGACCLPNKQCAQMDAAGCAAAGGTYHGDGSQCDTVNCGPISDGFNISRLPGSLPGTPPSSAGGSGQFDDGTGFNGWYYYENQEWWNIWFYDHPLDSNRYKKVTISFDLMPITAGIPVTLDFALNWATPLYSLDTFNTPPLPPILPGLEDQWIGRYLFPMELPEVDTVLMVRHYEFCYYFPDYNPEWVSIDIRGDNFEIFNGEITHECIYGPVPPIGRCCYSVAGSDSVLCQDTYECVCDYLGGDWVDSLNCADDPCPQPPPDSGACCLPDGSCFEADSNSCISAGGSWQGTGTGCSPNPCPQPQGACCLPDGTCFISGQTQCVSSGGTWQGGGTSCTPNPCPQPPPDSGACCMPDGSCIYTDNGTCGNLGGSWQGVGTSCSPNPCPQPPPDSGACCMPDGSCIYTDNGTCGNLGGSWQGVGTSCSPNPCPQPPPDSGACCMPDGSCFEADSNSCISAGGSWQGTGTGCSPNPCPQPQGACCLPDGTCFISGQTQCVSSGGTWQGGGTSCTPNPCPQPPPDSGACCMPDGSCVYTDNGTCGNLGGSWQGVGTSCSPNPCPQPPPDSGACCMPDGSCFEADSNSCINAGGSWQGTGTGCSPNPCPQPQGACCLPDGTCFISGQTQCVSSGGTWQGGGTSCTPNPCPQPPPDSGACCMPDGSCIYTDNGTCGNLGGSWQGVGTSCSPNPCPQPPPDSGACCMPDGSCFEADSNSCISAGGSWQGTGTGCSPNPCPQPQGACCLPDGTCFISGQTQCVSSGGTWQGGGTSCTPNPCPQPPPDSGACCMPDGSCVYTDNGTCGNLGGSWQGIGTSCSPNPCPQPPPDSGACCMPDGSCIYTDNGTCGNLGGSWQGAGSACSPNPCPEPSDTGACCLLDGSCIQTTMTQCGALCGRWQGLGTGCAMIACPPIDTITGVIRYFNQAQSPLVNMLVRVVDTAGIYCSDSMFTASDGAFEFHVWPGAYELETTTTSPWVFGAANSLDALRIARYFIQLDTMTGLKLVAADVNLVSSVNITDALLVMQRFVGKITSFAAGDWTFTGPMINTSTKSTTQQDVFSLIMGDVDGSYTPVKISSDISLKYNRNLIYEGNTIEVPLKVDRDINLASLSIDLTYLDELFEIQNVKMNTEAGEFVWNAEKGRLRIAWFSLQEVSWGEGNTILSLSVTPRTELNSNNLKLLKVNPHTLATDYEGQSQLFALLLPELESDNGSVVLGPNRPNPFTMETEISYYLPHEGEVLIQVIDATGRIIMIIEHDVRAAGDHIVSFNCRDCDPGVYYYRLRYSGDTDTQVKTRRMILSY